MVPTDDASCTERQPPTPHAGGGEDSPETVTDWHGVEAPADLDGVSLADGCPACGLDEGGAETWLECPACYYTCTRCYSTWEGDPTQADLVTYLEWSEDASPADLAPGEPEGGDQA